jgi:hypothetical protein
MAAISLPPPGSEFGPCPEPCEHRDCAESRRMATSLCPRCGHIIGYDRRFYGTKDWPELQAASPFIHADCLEDYADKQDRERGVGRWA